MFRLLRPDKLVIRAAQPMAAVVQDALELFTASMNFLVPFPMSISFRDDMSPAQRAPVLCRPSCAPRRLGQEQMAFMFQVRTLVDDIKGAAPKAHVVFSPVRAFP